MFLTHSLVVSSLQNRKIKTEQIPNQTETVPSQTEPKLNQIEHKQNQN